MKKITQKQMAFYKLYTSRKEDPEKYLPTWEFLGEMFIKELNEWVLMSYKCPTRLTDLWKQNPTLLERKLISGKSGSSYFGYRFNQNVSVLDVKDESLIEFYQKIKQ